MGYPSAVIQSTSTNLSDVKLPYGENGQWSAVEGSVFFYLSCKPDPDKNMYCNDIILTVKTTSEFKYYIITNINTRFEPKLNL